MAIAYIDRKSKYVIAVRDVAAPTVPDRLVAVTLNADESAKAGDKYNQDGNPRFVSPTSAPKKPAVFTAFQFLLRFTEE